MVSGVFSIPLDAHATTAFGKPKGPQLGLREYIGGRENALTQEAATAVLEGQTVHNPLVFHGPPATGKSHLLQGLAHRWQLEHPGSNIVFCCAADFARAYAHALDTDAVDEFRCKHRGTPLLVMDDLHHLDGKNAAQLELVRTLDAMSRRGGLFWAAARYSPSDLRNVAPSLTSRLCEGLTVPLRPPAAAARRAILRRLAESHALELPESVLQLLVQGAFGGAPLFATAPQLHHALLQLEAEARLEDRLIDADLTRRFLAGQRVHGAPTLRAITNAVSKHFHLPASQMKGPSRRREVVRARGVAILLTRRLTDASLEQLGRHFGGRDHTTVLHALRQTETLLATDAAIRQAVAELTAHMTMHSPAP